MTPNAPGMTVQQAMQQAQRHEAAGQSGAAEALYRQILAVDSRQHPAWHALALLALQAGQLPMACDLVGKAMAIDGSVAIYQRNYCEMCRRLGRFDDAIAAGRRAVNIDPRDVDAHYNLGLALADSGDHGAAVVAYRKALSLHPGHGLCYNNLGASLEKLGDKSGAEENYATAIAINPLHTEAQNNLGTLYSEDGQLEQAVRCFDAAIAARPSFVEAHFNLSALKDYTPADPHVMALETLADLSPLLPVESRIRLGFALGKAREDLGSWQRAFAAYAEGNRLRHAQLGYDEQRDIDMARAIARTFDAEFFVTRSGIGGYDGPRTPVFIVGMPRSGTSLIEQILASHPTLFGAGELTTLNDVIHAAPGLGTAPGRTTARPFTDHVAQLGADDFTALGQAYVDQVWTLAPQADFISDKMPANFFYIGMIHLMLPRAKIIHSMRDPMDSCFSCYARLFNDTMDFAYDLGTLGRYYVRYMQLMEHWRRVLPAGTVLDVRYEDVVADLEGQARRMVDHLGLPWDAKCLDFHRNKRLVKTASVAQVRKPIYSTSVARWRHYERQLQPLLDIVKDYRA